MKATKKPALSPLDQDALARSMKLCREQLRRGPQLDAMLKGDPERGFPPRDWFDVALFACNCVQDENLKLRPWEFAPCVGDVAGPLLDPNEPRVVQARELMYRLIG